MTTPTHAGRCLRAAMAAAVALAVALSLAFALPDVASADDDPVSPAAAQLRARGVHVSERALGEAAPAAAAALVRARAELAVERRTVALAIVPGPVGSPNLLVYARRLYREAELEGPLIVVAPGRPLAVTGTDAPAQAAATLARADVNGIANPVERLVAAAWLISVPAPEPDGTRELIILLVLAVLGGAWAVAWGAHRTDRVERARVAEERTHLRLGLDALRARAAAILADPDAAPAVHRAAERALALCSDTLGGVHEARTVADARALVPRIRGGFEMLASALPPDAPPLSPDDPFAGLCAVDPAHGPAADPATVAGLGDGCAVCPACAERARRGEALEPRMVPAGREVLPYPAAAGCLAVVAAQPALNA